MLRKIFLRMLTALLIVTGLLTPAIAGAAVQTFDGQGQWQTLEELDDEAMQLDSMARALQDAKNNAREKVVEHLKNQASAMNARLTEAEINAVAQNILEIIGEVHYEKKKVFLAAQRKIQYTASVKTKIDLNAVADFIKRDDREKSTIVEQNEQLQDAVEKNKEHAKALIEQYNLATTQAEKDRIRAEMKQAVYDFTANKKFESGNKFYYVKDYDGAIKLYSGALELDEYDGVYNNRGLAYENLKQYDLAIADYDRAIELNPNLALAYSNRGNVYADLKQYDRAIADYDKAIKLDPNFAYAYNNRGNTYNNMQRYDRALEDLNRALELNPNLAEIYNNRGIAYKGLQQYDLAIADYDKAIELDPNNAYAYRLRGVCHQQLGDTAKAQADFARAKELGYSG